MAKPYDRDTFNVSVAKNVNNVRSNAATQQNPLSTLKKIQYDSLFAKDKVELTERLAEVIAVEMDVKRPTSLNYFGNLAISQQNGQRSWVVAICRIADFDAATPQPEMTVDQNLKYSFMTATKIRQHGKFYVLADELRNKGFANLEVGDWVVVEFLDKTYLSNGMIKDVYYKSDLSTIDPQVVEDARIVAKASDAYKTPGALPGSLSVPVAKDPKFINPLANAGYRLSSRYGHRIHPKTKKPQNHAGIDMAAPEGVKIYAMEEGVVEDIKNDSHNGNGVVIKYTGAADGYRSTMIHMLKPPAVQKGQSLIKGQFLGYVGSTGTSTGFHLHLEIRKDGKLIDPATVINFEPWTPRDYQFDSSNASSAPTTLGEKINNYSSVDEIPVREGLDFYGNRVCRDQFNQVVACPEETLFQ
jgi:hypothetical protein